MWNWSHGIEMDADGYPGGSQTKSPCAAHLHLCRAQSTLPVPLVKGLELHGVSGVSVSCFLVHFLPFMEATSQVLKELRQSESWPKWVALRSTPNLKSSLEPARITSDQTSGLSLGALGAGHEGIGLSGLQAARREINRGQSLPHPAPQPWKSLLTFHPSRSL